MNFKILKALIIRGLDALTVDEAVKNTLNTTSNSTLPIKNCHIARDPFTKVSMGFCFVEMTSIQVNKLNFKNLNLKKFQVFYFFFIQGCWLYDTITSTVF